METHVQQQQQAKQKHLLGLKVMRLNKPSLMPPIVGVGEQWDATGRVMEEECEKDVRTTSSVPGLPISSILGLPNSATFARNSIFLGETYPVYVSLFNDSSQAVRDIVMKVEVSTPSQRHLLLQTPPQGQLEPDQRIDHTLSHDVKEMGDHTLVCTASYTTGAGEEMILRQIHKFSVARPLEVRPDFQIVEDDILFTVQIQNLMPHPVFLDVVSFDPAAGFTAVDLNYVQCDGERVSVFGQEDLFSSRNTCQYLYHISPQIPNHSTAGGTKASSVSVGKMDIVWRTQFGERGRIQTGQLKAIIPAPPELKLAVIESPGTVQLEQPFSFSVSVTNTTDRTMRLRSHLDRHPGAGVLWTGITSQTYQEIASKDTLELTFKLIPVLLGLQVIGPLSFVDVLTQRRYNFLKVSQVYVEDSSIHWTHSQTDKPISSNAVTIES